MEILSGNYDENVRYFKETLRTRENFDLISRRLLIGSDELTFFYIDGFVKDEVMQKLMQYFIGLKGIGTGSDAAEKFADSQVPYVEVDVAYKTNDIVTSVLSGAVLMLGSTFGNRAVVIDARTYPARSTEEPDNDRVVQGAHDGFVETLIFNTALIRRRIRDPRLTMHYVNMGGSSRTDVVLCYMDGVADPGYVAFLGKKLKSVTPQSLTLGIQNLAETLIRKRWYNPFPKVRLLERPDAAASELVEGRVIILADTSPQAMVLPTSVFDFMQETDDYYSSPIVGCYLRVIRHFVFWLSLYLTPLWYLLIGYGEALPPWLHFILPENSTMPILLQLFLVELAIDGLKLASMNTPSVLTNSLSVIGGLILGEFAVGIGWLSEEVIFYMAVVAIAGFTQQSYELAYSFKFMRLMLLVLTALFRLYGFIAGLLLVFVFLVTNTTLNGKRNYLYPLIPFNGRAFVRLFFRVKKDNTDGKKK